MIELKPYRGTTAVTSGEEDKKRLGGSTQTGKQAYPWHQNPTISNYATCFFIVLFLLVMCGSIATQTPFPICIGVIVAVLAVYIINRLWQNYLNQYVGQPTLLISNEHARRGEQVELRFRQPMRRALLVEKSTIEVFARETVRYKCGTDTCTDTYDHKIHIQIEQRPRTVSAGSAYEQTMTFTVPPEAMHSFAFSNNSLIWLIRVTLETQDFMTLSEMYSIQITPEVHTLL